MLSSLIGGRGERFDPAFRMTPFLQGNEQRMSSLFWMSAAQPLWYPCYSGVLAPMGRLQVFTETWNNDQPVGSYGAASSTQRPKTIFFDEDLRGVVILGGPLVFGSLFASLPDCRPETIDSKPDAFNPSIKSTCDFLARPCTVGKDGDTPAGSAEGTAKLDTADKRPEKSDDALQEAVAAVCRACPEKVDEFVSLSSGPNALSVFPPQSPVDYSLGSSVLA